MTLFACAISQPLRWLSAGLISVSFVYWKSPYSEPLVVYLNGALPLGIGHTTDYTDLIALPIVWFAAFYVPRLSAPRVSSWLKCASACFSLVAFTATSYIPQYTIRETGDIPSEAGRNTERASNDLERAVDRIAARHGLTCTICDPISEGRLYKTSRAASLSLLARFDETRNQVLYEIWTHDVGRSESGSRDADGLRAELVDEFRRAFPLIAISRAGIPAWEDSISLGVSKRKGGSYRDPENQADFERARRLVAEVVKSYGLRNDEPSDVYYLGGLLGRPPYGRELVVYVGIADDPLVTIRIYRLSERFADLQKAIAKDVERRLKEEFGANRAGQRCWIFACYGS